MTSAPVHTDKLLNPGSAPKPAAQQERTVTSESEQSSLWPTFTLAIWIICLGVGIAGLLLNYARPQAQAKAPEPVQAEILKVELTSDPVPPPEANPPPPSTPPPLLNPITPPEAPPAVAVAAPSPAIAFALPVQVPTRVVEAKQASYSQTPAPSNAVQAPALPVQTLQFGQGAGKQPAPRYPHQAEREGQEGTVVVRFSVDENGRVLEAEAASPCPWPLLNEAALKVIRERWRFAPGRVHVYEVSMRFQLTK